MEPTEQKKWKGGGPGRPAAERFWEKVDKNGPIPDYAPHLGPCWLWLASRDVNGYGQFMAKTRHVPAKAYRWAYEATVGPVPAGLQLDHLCRVRLCVNPSHLEPVTGEENMRRQFAAVTHCPQGHAYTPENTRMWGRQRRCIACDVERQRQKLAEMTPEQRAERNAKKRADYHAKKAKQTG